MNQNHQPTLRIRGPVDLLSAVPYLLGFHPIESLVLIGLTHGALVVTARLDLADAVEHDVLIAETLQGDAARWIHPVPRRHLLRRRAGDRCGHAAR